MPTGRLGTLITRGAILERPKGARWYLAVPVTMTVQEIAALMCEFGLLCELLDDDIEELRLYPIDYRIPPTGAQLAEFYQRGPRFTAQPVRFVQLEAAT